MPKLKLAQGALIGDTWHEAGAIVEVDSHHAPQFLAQGATPVGPDTERAVHPATEHAEKAVAPPHKAK